jgi:poly-gamma-glutamate capsule biosynthesis protein CapA/YwtB (metallophosphatase superfamily)
MHPTKRRDGRGFRGAFALCAVIGAGFVCWGSLAAGQAQRSGPVARDMAMKIAGPFTLASVGDLLILRPAATLADPGLQAALKVVRDADIAFGNLESLMSDKRNFDGPMRGWMGTKDVAADIKAMGFDLLNRANNHAFDSEHQGMFATHALLEQAGLVYAGAGKNLEDARAAQFLETPKGRVGLVGMHTPNGREDDPPGATERFGDVGGRPGVNAIQLERSLVVTADQFAALKKIRDAIYERRAEYSGPVRPPSNQPTDRLQLFNGTNGVVPASISFKVGEKPGSIEYVMNADDLRGTLRSIRNGKQFSDFMIATVHAHQAANVLQQYGDTPPNFLVELAHKSIDNGADAFIGHGVHVVRGVEIYQGKPIFYGLGEFFCEMQWAPVESRTYRGRKLDPLTTEVTEAELGDSREPTPTGTRIDYESILALSKFDGGRLAEIQLYPIELRYDGPLSQWGIPRIAPPEIGRRILERVQALSTPLGTTIKISGNTGVIKVTP